MPIVYVIDNDPVLRESLKLLLGAEGFSVETFSTAQKFLRQRSPIEPGCVLTEIYMADEATGFEVLSAVSGWGPDWPVIVLTVDYDLELRQAALAQGASDFLEKPCPPDELVAAVQNALRGGIATISAAFPRRSSLLERAAPPLLAGPVKTPAARWLSSGK